MGRDVCILKFRVRISIQMIYIIFLMTNAKWRGLLFNNSEWVRRIHNVVQPYVYVMAGLLYCIMHCNIESFSI